MNSMRLFLILNFKFKKRPPQYICLFIGDLFKMKYVYFVSQLPISSLHLEI